jgi:hypothetical protein
MKRLVGCCAGITLIMLLLGALLLLVGFPTAINYIGSLDMEIVFDLQVGEHYSFGNWDLIVTSIRNTSVDFEITGGETFTLSLNELHNLPGGYVIRLVAINETIIRTQLFAPCDLHGNCEMK